MTDQEHSGWVS